MTSTGLVYMMTPALACFYGGLVESKNFLNQLFLSIVCMAIIPVQWCLFGYSFAFGPGNSVFGSFDYAVDRKIGLVNLYGENVDENNPLAVPSLTFSAFQCAFAIITPALISGAVVGRMKLIPYMIFVFLWTTFCYDPLARWLFFSQGWLRQMGVIDFAGGLVVHMSSGISGLVAAFILGSRAHFDPDVVNTGQTNLPFTIVGTGLLWVGWMGFNGGSALSATGNAALAIVNSNIAAASSMTIWIILDIIHGKLRGQNNVFVSIPGICSATVVGLVVITPDAAYIQPGYAMLVGAIGGCVINLFLTGKKHFFHVDDTLDVFSCHGLGGFIGTMMTGLFTQTDVSSDVQNGAFYGNPVQLAYQLFGIVIVAAYSVVCTAAILLPMHFTIGIRINRLDQVRGLDNVAHGVIDTEAPQKIPQIKITSMKNKPNDTHGLSTVTME
ncbi:unnamed protein product [Rotaria sp. Silwood2]|nr:unnamed protein product [Rotaria sp. Silwood2]CAF2660351.1 unnamed protein product [Rotaria sp. Silwood2]CAF2949294.1 unnamed protein product [Rotaria sp. Silwood2]CAF3078019.1 unnamed protein product [Rotaria sp. Silwood2]CAF4087782.1 unnamed protein product [Rotaria sp. Silwood2]